MANLPSRRSVLKAGASAAAALPLIGSGRSFAAGESAKPLTIAANVNLTSFNPTLPTALSNPLQSFYATIFDPFIAQKPDLSYAPGIVTKWGWNADKTKIQFEVRSGAVWHNGDPLTVEDVVWSLDRAAKPENRNPMRFIWSTLGNYQIDGQTVTADVVRFEPTIFKWFGFLSAYVLPKAYIEKVGLDGFEQAPIGSGPYQVDHFERNSYLRLKANKNYWGGAPAFDTVIFKLMPDSASRVAEVESGSSDLTYNIPYEEYDRLRQKPGLQGLTTPVTNVGVIFITNRDVMLDSNVRLAAQYAIDKQAIVTRLLRGYATPLSTLEAPGYAAYDPTIKFPYDPDKAAKLLAASGYSPKQPVKVGIQTTQGLAAKDYEIVQAIVGMWRKVGIEANVEVYDVAKRSALQQAHQLDDFAFLSWSNSTGDPTNSTGFSMYDKSLQSAWKDRTFSQMMDPLWSEKDETKRIDGWKQVCRKVAEDGLIIPLLQYQQPIIYRKGLKVTPFKNEMVLPAYISPA